MADFACGAGTDLPLDMDTAWDGAAARQAMFEWAGYGGDSPDSAKLRRGFLVWDRSEPSLKGSFHLPFCTVKSGTLTALASGCRAAASRLEQMDNLPQAVHDKARGVLDGYFKKISAEKSDNAQALDGEYFGPVDWFPVRVLPLSERAGSPPDEELLSLAKQRAQDPTIFDEFPPTFFSGIASTSKRDSYSTNMHGSSLRNFAADLTEGRVLLDSHDTSRLGIGYSLRGQYTGAGGNGVQKASGDWFSAPTSDDAISFIRKMKAGMVRDLSGGFYGGQWICNLDGNEIGRWNEDPEKRCLHWPGMEYDGQTATATIHNARLAEVSAVYDGATPGAMILRARQMSEAGLIEPALARLLEVQYRIKLPASQRSWPGALLREEGSMPETPAQETPPAETRAAAPQGEAVRVTPEMQVTEASHLAVITRNLATDLGPQAAADPVAGVRALVTEVIELRALKAENERLQPLAKDGEAYRKDLIDETLAEGTRALGTAFAVEANRTMLEGQSLATIKAQRDQWQALAAGRFTGGRLTLDQGEPRPADDRLTPATPDAAFLA